MISITMNVKRKGNAGERKFRDWLRLHLDGFFARNSSSGSGIQKSDIHNDIGFNFEVKTCKRINLQQAWKQSQRDADMTHSIPTLAIHFDGMSEWDWLVVMSNHDWLSLYKKSQEPKMEQNPDREFTYLLKTLLISCKKVISRLEK